MSLLSLHVAINFSSTTVSIVVGVLRSVELRCVSCMPFEVWVFGNSAYSQPAHYMCGHLWEYNCACGT